MPVFRTRLAKKARTIKLRAFFTCNRKNSTHHNHLFRRKSASAAAKRESMPAVGAPSLLTM